MNQSYKKFGLWLRQIVPLLLTFLCSGMAFAQEWNIVGSVYMDDNEPVVGATVMVKGTSRGTLTDLEGKFNIKASKGQTLQVRYVGFKPIEVKVKDNSPLSLTMQSEDNALDEVVVTALGISREARSLSYAHQNVNVESMTEARGTNLMDMLSGKAAGMQIVAGGGPTASTRVVIRGNNSITGNNQPLYVIDGVPVLNDSGEDGDLDYGNPINSLNPDEIENIEVLKGANASALYGSDAANGVILITTKKAEKKKGLGVTYNYNMMFGHLYSFPTYQNIYGAGQNVGFQRSQGVNYYGNQGNGNVYDPTLPYGIWNPNMAGQDQRSWGMPMLGFDVVGRNGEVKKYTAQPNNIKSMYQTSTMITNSVAIDKVFQGGSFRLSYTNVHSNDIVENVNKLDRHNFNFRGHADLASYVTVEASARYTYESVDNRNYRNASNRNPMYIIANLPRDASVDELIPWKRADGTSFNFNGFVNPYWVLNETSNADSKNLFNGNVTVTGKLPYNLRLRGRVATDAQFYDGWKFTNMYAPFDSDGEYTRWKRQWINNNFDILLSWNQRLIHDRLNINANVGASAQNIKGSKINSYVKQLQFPDIKSLSNNQGLMSSGEEWEHKKKQAVFGQASLGWDQWGYIDLTARNEWSSTLPKNNNSYFYWSAGASVIVNELFKLNNSIFPFIKLRGSFAQVGNDTGFDRLISGYYKDTNQFVFNGITYYIGDKTLRTMALKPERTRSWELGAELHFWNNRVQLDATYYNKVTRDQIIEADAPIASGYEREMLNAGKMQNKGIELSLTVTPVQTRLFTWHTTINWSKNNNKVLELSPGVDRFELGSGDNIKLYAQVGQPYGVFYGNDYRIDPETGAYVVQVGDARPIGDVDQYLGKIEPEWFGGWVNNFKIWDFDLSFALDFQKGGKVWSYTAYRGGIDGNTVQSLEGRFEYFISKYILKEENLERQGYQRKEDIPGGVDYSTPYADASRPKGVEVNPNSIYDPESNSVLAGQMVSDAWVNPMDYWTHNNGSSAARYIYDASYVKLREISVGYNLPSKWLRKAFFKSVKLSFVGRNVAILYQKTPKGLDPQATSTTGNAQGFERGFNLPQATYGFDIKVTF